MLACLVLVAAGMLPAFRLVLLVLACWFLFSSLVVRSSGPVLDGVDDVLDEICLVCLLGLLG
jgi:hypothetical protein